MDSKLTAEEIKEHEYTLHTGYNDVEYKDTYTRVGNLLEAQRHKIHEWGNENCPHIDIGIFSKAKKRECPLCWEELEG